MAVRLGHGKYPTVGAGGTVVRAGPVGAWCTQGGRGLRALHGVGRVHIRGALVAMVPRRHTQTRNPGMSVLVGT